MDQSCNVRGSSTQQQSSCALIWSAHPLLNRLENLIAAMYILCADTIAQKRDSRQKSSNVRLA